MFWGMLEMGVAMIAVCLPTLRLLFHGFSPESFIRSLRSALTLGSVGTRKRSYHSSSTNPHQRADSETALADLESSEYATYAGQHQVYAMGPVMLPRDKEKRIRKGGVRVDKKLTQTVETV